MLFNPFAPYSAKYLPHFKEKGVVAFVKQTYDRGRNLLDEKPLPASLLTHHNDLKMAKTHMDAIKHDLGRRLFMIDNAEDYAELLRLGRPGAGERVYMRLAVPNALEKARRMLDKRLRAYIELKLKWNVPGYSKVKVSLDFIFSDIYVVIQYAGKSNKVKIEEIETSSGYVL